MHRPETPRREIPPPVSYEQLSYWLEEAALDAVAFDQTQAEDIGHAAAILRDASGQCRESALPDRYWQAAERQVVDAVEGEYARLRPALLDALTLLGRLSASARKHEDQGLNEERNQVIARGWKAMANSAPPPCAGGAGDVQTTDKLDATRSSSNDPDVLTAIRLMKRAGEPDAHECSDVLDVADALREARLEEREAIVRYLRRDDWHKSWTGARLGIAQQIEEGAHQRPTHPKAGGR